MTETPAEAMGRFIDKISSITDMSSRTYASTSEGLDDGVSFLKPFLANPELHQNHVRALLEGISLMATLQAVRPLAWVADNFLMRKLGGGDALQAHRKDFTKKLVSMRGELLTTLDPGELKIDILPARAKKIEGGDAATRLIVFQLNLAIYPRSDFVAQTLSVRFNVAEPAVQFESVEPSTKADAIGSYQIGIEESGKFIQSRKETTKLAFKIDAKVAATDSEISEEETTTVERAAGRSITRSGEEIVPLIVSSALGNEARWELIRAPRQPLRGGFSFFATAFVATGVQSVTLEARVRTELTHFGAHEVTLQRRVELPSGLGTVQDDDPPSE